MAATIWATRRSCRATGAAAPEVVWERYSTPTRWTQWAPHLTGVQASTPVIRAGTTGTVTALHVVRARFVVTEVDEAARSWSWTVRTGPVRLHLEHTVTGARDCGTSTGLSVEGPGLVVAAYLPIAARALQRLVTP
ncbi:SRPBCC family protein [Arsenicicoccus cauae]|uniref:SRPBCC family protein n=1 Tax=Arsenicicoccus cauae TaxID=2663847 RepID=A0A6I3IHR7_9MICO|nr:SRPBCC family protein [Arsenicicoccus cauae]MTB71185.1 SRPBCC family protein [Arsenicicoccus cauae]